jgi:hypothetical protein
MRGSAPGRAFRLTRERLDLEILVVVAAYRDARATDARRNRDPGKASGARGGARNAGEGEGTTSIWVARVRLFTSTTAAASPLPSCRPRPRHVVFVVALVSGVLDFRRGFRMGQGPPRTKRT